MMYTALIIQCENKNLSLFSKSFAWVYYGRVKKISNSQSHATWWMSLCFNNWSFRANLPQQMSHIKGCVWILLWTINWSDLANAFWHILHTNSFSPVWIVWCRTKWWFSLNALWHTLHLNGFSSEWIFFRPSVAECCLESLELTCSSVLVIQFHLKLRFSPLQYFSCLFKLQLLVNDFVHFSHEKVLRTNVNHGR